MNATVALEEQLREELRDATKSGAICSLLVRGYGIDCDIDIVIRPEDAYEAMSLGKLGIICYALDQVERELLDLEDVVVILDDHKRPGTGVLQFCPEGTEVPLGTLIEIILIESDNTGTNALIDHIGDSQSTINDWLMRHLELCTTGLHDRDDLLFESDIIKPEDVMKLLEWHGSRESFSLVFSALDRSHCRSGLRGFSKGEKLGWLKKAQLEVADTLNAFGLASEALSKRLLNTSLRNKPSRVAALKEGFHPDFCDQRYFHEAGWFLGSQHDFKVVLQTIDAPPATITRIGEILYNWSEKE